MKAVNPDVIEYSNNIIKLKTTLELVKKQVT